MQELKLKREYLADVLGEIKYQTIRKGKREVEFGPLRLFCDIVKAEVIVEVEGISFKQFKDLDVRDAMADGFASEEVLRKNLTEIYGDIAPEEVMTLIQFRLSGEGV